MSNVVYLNVPGPKDRRATAIGAMIRSFSALRRGPEDVFWLKENAELLSILVATKQDVPQSLLEAYAPFYDAAEEKLAFFPQYYRFILSIALDLEALGMSGSVAERLCHWAREQDLAGGETSDIQRQEAARLLARRGLSPVSGPDDAERRLRDFIAQPKRFALPNKKAAFELTHIVFYLSEYGRKDPQLDPTVQRSLENAGIVAFLDGNIDLLAEICVAMRYAGFNYVETWGQWIAHKVKDMDIDEQRDAQGGPVPVADQYHEYLTANWFLGTRGDAIFAGLEKLGQGGRLSFHRTRPASGALREMTMQLYRMGDTRAADWSEMRGRMDPALSDAARDHLDLAVQSASGFDAFFEDFARAKQVGS